MYQYPYGNAQQLNLDWILSKLQELESGSGGGADLEEVANALVSASFDATIPYRKYDYAFYDGKLYRALNDTIGAFNPADWLEVTLGADIPVLTRLVNADSALITTLQNKVDNLGSDDVANESTVTGNTVTDALGALNGAINDISTTTNTLFTLDGLQIGVNHSGVANAARAISADIYCENGLTCKAAYLPTNLKYEICTYSGTSLSNYTGFFPDSWVTDTREMTSIGRTTAQHYRIHFASVNGNALTQTDFDGLVFQANNGSKLAITAEDTDARQTANNAENLGEGSYNALSNFGNAIVSFQYLYDSLSIPAGGTRSTTPNNLANKPSNYTRVGVLNIFTGNAKILIRGFDAFSGELNLVNIDNQAQTFTGSARVYCIDTDILSSFFA